MIPWMLERGSLSIEFNNGLDVDGNQWLVVDHDGWDSGAWDAQAFSKTGDHGGVTPDYYMGARPVSLDIACIPAADEAAACKTALVRICSSFSSSVKLSGPSDRDSISLDYLMVRCGAPRIKHTTTRTGAFVAQLSMIADFPIKLTDDDTPNTQTFNNGDTLNLAVGGSAPTPWELTIPTTSTAWTFENESITGGNALLSGQAIAGVKVLDSLDRTYIIGGTTSAYNKLTSTQWWQLQPDQTNSVAYTGPNGAVLEWKDAWL